MWGRLGGGNADDRPAHSTDDEGPFETRSEDLRGAVIQGGGPKADFTIDNLGDVPYAVYAVQDVDGNEDLNAGDWVDRTLLEEGEVAQVRAGTTGLQLELVEVKEAEKTDRDHAGAGERWLRRFFWGAETGQPPHGEGATVLRGPRTAPEDWRRSVAAAFGAKWQVATSRLFSPDQ